MRCTAERPRPPTLARASCICAKAGDRVARCVVAAIRAQRGCQYGGAIHLEVDAAIVLVHVNLVQDSAAGSAIQVWPLVGPESLCGIR